MGEDEVGKLFIGAVDKDTTQEEFQNYFAKYGELADCVLMKDPDTPRNRGFGFVKFVDPTNADAVLNSGEVVLNGKKLDPKKCTPRGTTKPKSASASSMMGEADTPHKIFVGGLPQGVTEEEITKCFNQFGQVSAVKLAREDDTKRTRGFGFVSFMQARSAQEACKERYVECGGKQVECKPAEVRGNRTKTDDKSGPQGQNNWQGGPPGPGGFGPGGPGGPGPFGYGPGGWGGPPMGGWGGPPMGNFGPGYGPYGGGFGGFGGGFGNYGGGYGARGGFGGGYGPPQNGGFGGNQGPGNYGGGQYGPGGGFGGGPSDGGDASPSHSDHKGGNQGFGGGFGGGYGGGGGPNQGGGPSGPSGGGGGGPGGGPGGNAGNYGGPMGGFPPENTRNGPQKGNFNNMGPGGGEMLRGGGYMNEMNNSNGMGGGYGGGGGAGGNFGPGSGGPGGGGGGGGGNQMYGSGGPMQGSYGQQRMGNAQQFHPYRRM